MREKVIICFLLRRSSTKLKISGNSGLKHLACRTLMRAAVAKFEPAPRF